MDISTSSSSSACAIEHRRAREASVALNNTAVSLLSRHNCKEAIDTFKDALDMMRSSFHHMDNTEVEGDIAVDDHETMKVDHDEQDAEDMNTATSANTTAATTTTTTSTSMTSTSTSQCSSTIVFDTSRQIEVNEPLHRASLLLARSSSATRLTENIFDTKNYDLVELADDMNAIAVETKLHQIEDVTTEAKCCPCFHEHRHDVDNAVLMDACIRSTTNTYHVVRIHSLNDDDDDDVENAIHKNHVLNSDLNFALILLNYGVACRIYALECMDTIDQSSKMMIHSSQFIGLAHDVVCNINLNEQDERNIVKFTLLSALILQSLIQICFHFQMNEEFFHIYFVQIKKLRLLLEDEICHGTLSSLSYNQRAAAAA